MNKITTYILILFLLLSGSFALGKDITTIVIDAGHGGKDSGTRARSKKHQHEKVIVLSIAKKLGYYIERNCPDVKVIYTRTKDVYPTLEKRARLANEANADLFISIHVDAIRNTKTKGASIYVLGLHKTEENLKVAMRENAVMLQEKNYETKYAGFDPKNPESYIIFSLMQNQYLDNSMLFANFVNNHLKKETKRYTKGVKQSGFFVLREVAMPSILVETGYITNTSDANYLCSKKGQTETALAIYKAFKEYKKYIEGHSTDLQTLSLEKEATKTDAFFAVQVLFSSKDLSLKSKRFRGLTPIKKIKKGKNFLYLYGHTQSYKKAKELQKKARKYIPDAYLVGVSDGHVVDALKLRDILNGK